MIHDEIYEMILQESPCDAGKAHRAGRATVPGL